MLEYQVSDSDLQKRVDVFLQKRMLEHSRNYLQTLIKDGKVRFNDQVVSPGYKFKQTGSLRVDYQTPKPPPAKPLEVVFEDDNLLILNKPSGLLTHAKNKYWQEPTVAAFLRQHCRWPSLTFPAALSQLRRGLVHRLDRGTSGVMVCAKDEKTQKDLQQQFKDGSVEKTYWALIGDQTKLPAAGIIDKPIIRSPSHRGRFKVGWQGRKAQTYFQIKASNNGYRLLELQPKTGRTHQIRVHLASLNCPIIGDFLYNGEKSSRLMLHARQLAFVHPQSRQEVSFKVIEPALFKKKLKIEINE